MTGLTHFGVDCIAPGFHTSLHGTTIEGWVAWRHVDRIKPEGEEGSGIGLIQPESL
jgi:hypothetical protein